jgi:hypothetical protein
MQATLGMGTVQKPDFEGCLDYSIDRADHIRAILLIFNGNMVMPTRAPRFVLFLAKYNALSAVTRNGPEIPLIEGTILPTLEDDWLLGFTEAFTSFWDGAEPPAVCMPKSPRVSR